MANTVFENKIIEAKAKDLLITAVNARNYMTIDNSLAEEAGMTKTINVYEYSGEAEELGVGEGNSAGARGSITYTPHDYTVKTVQQTYDYYDEDFMKDPSIVDNMLKGATQVMANKMTADFLTECDKATLGVTFANGAAIDYDTIVDGISKLNLEDETGVFLELPNEWKAAIRKDEDYKSARQGEVVYSGQVGAVAGVPVIPTKALNAAGDVDARAFVMTKEAVKLFLKKDIEVEQKRDIETRKNTVVLRAFYICALEHADKICKVSEATA